MATLAAVQAHGFLLEEIVRVSSADPEVDSLQNACPAMHVSALLLDWSLVL